MRVATLASVDGSTPSCHAADPGITPPTGDASGRYAGLSANERMTAAGRGTVLARDRDLADGRIGDLSVVASPHPDLVAGGHRLPARVALHAGAEGRRPGRRHRDDGSGAFNLARCTALTGRRRLLHSRRARARRAPDRPGHSARSAAARTTAASPPATPPAGASPPRSRRRRWSGSRTRPAIAAASAPPAPVRRGAGAGRLLPGADPMPSRSFSATVVRDGPSCFVALPFDPKAVFGKVRAPVVVTVNGYTFRRPIVAMGGPVCIGLRKSHREAAGLEGGETVAVTVALDTAPRTVTAPADLLRALKAVAGRARRPGRPRATRISASTSRPSRAPRSPRRASAASPPPWRWWPPRQRDARPGHAHARRQRYASGSRRRRSGAHPLRPRPHVAHHVEAVGPLRQVAIVAEAIERRARRLPAARRAAVRGRARRSPASRTASASRGSRWSRCGRCRRRGRTPGCRP